VVQLSSDLDGAGTEGSTEATHIDLCTTIRYSQHIQPRQS
jgi:hypothetical protein